MFAARDTFFLWWNKHWHRSESWAKHFSKLNANSGFWQMELDPETAKVTTFITPVGRFCFNRLPFGITWAPEHFQRRMTEILGDIEGVVCLVDDILVSGKTQEEHDQWLMAVLTRLSKAGITLGIEKCEINKQSVKFLGQLVDEDRVKPDPNMLFSRWSHQTLWVS